MKYISIGLISLMSMVASEALAQTKPHIHEQGSIVQEVQLPNSNFEHWYAVKNDDNYYDDIGESANSKNTWSTGNAGYVKGVGRHAVRGSMPTDKVQGADGGFAARLTTHEVGLGIFAKKGIAAGSLFTGVFYIDPNSRFLLHDNQIRPIFGVPFTGKPKSFSFKYKYIPAKVVENGRDSKIDGMSDAMDAYVILENRSGGSVKRLAIGWFRSGATQSTWKEQTVPLVYAHGSAPAGLQDYEKRILKYGPETVNERSLDSSDKQPLASWGDIATMNPTHIIVVFSSSYEGDDFIGAPGSTLTVDDFKLNY
ncbi:hypothetical protein BKH43_07750 [Helicobacter sp. 13S00401-1]|uniref:PCMD domain-containing protein n=1 Tax=Helicobacter sp. 13S00401-1 TaxID=1905758 RepID=UPI000BA70540|nr:PCMD domain-containing protein [Helicobacter sp. 13S00401-1]PAF48788.1 hypothetical protein BKH43_07750 [Helicobacter sp. 13S00401-1]